MSDSVDALILDLLEWIGQGARPYAEVIEAWRTSCPRLPVWEEANERGFIEHHYDSMNGKVVSVSALGLEHLRSARTKKYNAMQKIEPLNPNYKEDLEQGFASQRMMETIGAYLISVEPGQVEIGLNFREDLTQQHGYLHAGIVTAIVDSACGFAAYSLMPVGSGVLTVEYKVNLLSPARGEKFIATGQVIKPGRTLTVCSGEVYAIEGEERRQIAMMQATIIGLAGKEA